MATGQKVVEKSSTKTFTVKLNSCSEVRFCAILSIINCWKHSHSTEYWCQLQSRGDKNSLLCWDRRHVDNIFLFFCCYDQSKKKHIPVYVAANVQNNWDVSQCMQNVKRCIHLPFWNLLLAPFLAIALLSSDSFVMHYGTCLYLKEVTF